jgi:hypothetical protein
MPPPIVCRAAETTEWFSKGKIADNIESGVILPVWKNYNIVFVFLASFLHLLQEEFDILSDNSPIEIPSIVIQPIASLPEL